MSVNNLQDYIQQLEIRIQLLKQQIETLHSKISEVEKEFAFRSKFLEKEVSNEIADIFVHGLDLSLPTTNTDRFIVSTEDLRVALGSLFKLN